jgi:hypothetical protein
MARGVIVLDSNVVGLAAALREANIKVVEIPAGTPEAVVRHGYLPHRILVTSNAKDFLDDAPIHEFGVVSLEKLKSIDTSPSFANNATAQLISRGISGYGLWSRGAKFLLELRDDGNHVLTPLE